MYMHGTWKICLNNKKPQHDHHTNYVICIILSRYQNMYLYKSIYKSNITLM